MLLHLFVADVGQVRPVGRLGRVLRVDVQILEEKIINGLNGQTYISYESRIKLGHFSRKQSNAKFLSKFQFEHS